MFRTSQSFHIIYSMYIVILYLKYQVVFSESIEADDSLGPESKEKPVVEVRAVFINCQLEGQGGSDTEASRFQREELFKHNVLRDCKKKLALALKVSSEPDQNSDEYIPIDHISDGPNKKRVRLLNPYVLRVRWDSPLQFYKLRRIDTVTGLLTANENRLAKKENKHKNKRMQRNSIPIEKANKLDSHILESASSTYVLKRGNKGLHGYSDNFGDMPNIRGVATNITVRGYKVETDSCKKKVLCNQSLTRDKRHEHNIMIEQTIEEIPWRSNPHSSGLGQPSARLDVLEGPAQIPLKYFNSGIGSLESKTLESRDNEELSVLPKTRLMIDNARTELSKIQRVNSGHNIRKSDISRKMDKINQEVPYLNSKRPTMVVNNVESTEKNFAVYEIGNPGLWCTANVQLYEKLTTPEGKTVWNDLTRGETVKISSLAPEWATQDVNIRYRPADWIGREDFSLPFTTSLYLLVPLSSENGSRNNFETTSNKDSTKDYIIVPSDDLVPIDNERIDFKRDGLHTNRQYRNVLIRVSRAWLTDPEDNLNIVVQEPDQYLTLPHRKPHHVQIDVEVRADDNDLIIVGLKASSCGPELLNLMNYKNIAGNVAGPILLPPRHTRQLSLELPCEVPGGMVHCTVALINDEDQAVAVRDVRIKQADRCFCVWHCDCVCLSEYSGFKDSDSDRGLIYALTLQRVCARV